ISSAVRLLRQPVCEKTKDQPDSAEVVPSELLQGLESPGAEPSPGPGSIPPPDKNSSLHICRPSNSIAARLPACAGRHQSKAFCRRVAPASPQDSPPPLFCLLSAARWSLESLAADDQLAKATTLCEEPGTLPTFAISANAAPPVQLSSRDRSCPHPSK